MTVYESADLFAAPAGYPEEPPQRDFVLHRLDGSEWAMTHWTQADITWNFDGVTLQITMPGTDPTLEWLIVLATDIYVYREQIMIHRLRVIDAGDTFNADGHEVVLTAVDYAQLLRRRVLFHDRNINKDQFDAAWELVAYTQAYQSFGITRGTTGTSGQNRDRLLQRGQSIADAINELARADNGFDWWVDKDLKFWMQRPRRFRDLNVEWKWGVEVREIQRTSAAPEYASVVMIMGATSDTQIGATTYPPPAPQIMAATSMPVGRWERTYSYTDVVTVASLQAKGRFHLKDLTAMRATYALTIEPNVWRPYDVTVGDMLWLRIESPPRMNVRSKVRIEEIKITLTAESEQITMAVRSEQPEEVIPVTAFTTEVLPQAGPTEEQPIDVSTVEHGASTTLHRLDPVMQFARLLTGFNGRVERLERTQGPSGGGVIAAIDEVWIGTSAPTEPTIELWYDPDA